METQPHEIEQTTLTDWRYVTGLVVFALLATVFAVDVVRPRIKNYLLGREQARARRDALRRAALAADAAEGDAAGTGLAPTAAAAAAAGEHSTVAHEL
eukprot:c9511_g1_i1.p1 GENE.c9511_g1_i1~~c9511_g1_i1.p1  ORF type:complete len:111 (-),score=12.27 c9511_g1_i1:56-349(-)